MKQSVANHAFSHQDTDEQIDVLRIRLWNAKNATAVLSDYYNTERILNSWAQIDGGGTVRFEVSFADGCVLRGCYEFFRKGKRRCTFSTHLRRIIKFNTDLEFCSPLPLSWDVSRYAIPAY